MQEDFFQHLRLYCWNFFEYKVLELLINNHCTKELKKTMRVYSADIQRFKEGTTITDFIRSETGSCLVKTGTKVPETFKKLTTEYHIDPDTYSLSDLDAFCLSFCLHRKLSDCAIQAYSIKYGSIIVKWIFPKSSLTP